MSLLLALQSGGAGVTANLNWTEASEAQALSVTLTDNITLSWTELTETQALVANLLDNAIISYTEQSETFALSVNLLNNTALSWTEQGETFALNVVLAISVSGALTWTESSDSMVLTGIVGTPSLQAMPYNLPLPPITASFRRAASPRQYKH